LRVEGLWCRVQGSGLPPRARPLSAFPFGPAAGSKNSSRIEIHKGNANMMDEYCLGNGNSFITDDKPMGSSVGTHQHGAGGFVVEGGARAFNTFKASHPNMRAA